MKAYGDNPRDIEIAPTREVDVVMTLPNGDVKGTRFVTDASDDAICTFCASMWGGKDVQFPAPDNLEVPEDVEGMTDDVT